MREITKELETNMSMKESSLFNEPRSLELFHLTSLVEGVQTLKARDYKDPQVVMTESNIRRTVYDWHRQDTRMTECKDVCVTAAAGWGGGGNNMPYVLEKKVESYQETTGPLMASGYAKNGTQEAMVRRLTPTECALLQGYPGDWMDIGEWTDSKGKVHKDADAPKYKAAGNSIALPFWQWLAERICAQYDRPVKMASLFDGVSGFPLVFAQSGAEPIWSSEIEEFPIAVAKKHFGDDEKGIKGDYESYL